MEVHLFSVHPLWVNRTGSSNRANGASHSRDRLHTTREGTTSHCQHVISLFELILNESIGIWRPEIGSLFTCIIKIIHGQFVSISNKSISLSFLPNIRLVTATSLLSRTSDAALCFIIISNYGRPLCTSYYFN